MNDELNELIAKVCDGRADDNDRARLTELLRRDPAARDEYLRQTDLHAALADEAMPLAESNIINYTPRELTEPTSGLGWIGAWKLAAVLAVLLAAGSFFFRGPVPGGSRAVPAQVSARPIATVLFAEDCRWQEYERVEGGRLSAERLGLLSGTAVVRLDGGAEVVLTGPVDLELESPGSARLHYGDVVVRAEQGAEGFTVHTPISDVVDLGTEFAVKVAKSGETEVHVLDGEIELRKRNDASVLRAGHAVRVARADAVPESVALNSPRFAELIRRVAPRERRDLMTVYEGFHYPAGRYAPADIVKGKGWAGPWRLRSQHERRRHRETDTSTDMHIVHGRLNVVWPIPGGRLGMLEMPGGRTFRVRPMAAPIDLGADGITYFSLMTHEPEHARRTKGEPVSEGVRLTFRSSGDYWGEALSFGLSHRLHPQIQNGIGTGFNSPLRIPDEQSLLWIGKIVSRAGGEDEVSFRIYGQQDQLDFAEPAAWHVVSHGFEMRARLDLVLLTSHGASPRIVDELRIGPTWRSVVPIRKMAQLH